MISTYSPSRSYIIHSLSSRRDYGQPLWGDLTYWNQAWAVAGFITWRHNNQNLLSGFITWRHNTKVKYVLFLAMTGAANSRTRSGSCRLRAPYLEYLG